jgi:hypothetical protein
MHDLRSPADGAENRAQQGFDAVVEWQLPKQAPPSPGDTEVLLDLVALEATNPWHEPTGNIEAERVGRGSQ